MPDGYLWGKGLYIMSIVTFYVMVCLCVVGSIVFLRGVHVCQRAFYFLKLRNPFSPRAHPQKYFLKQLVKDLHFAAVNNTIIRSLDMGYVFLVI